MFERVINTQLLWEDFDKGRVLYLHHENTIEEDIDQKLRVLDEGLSRGVLTVNDWRSAMGYERDERNGDVYLRSIGTVEVPFNSEPIDLPEEETVELPEEEPKESVIEIEKEMTEEEFEKIKNAYEKKYTVLKSEEDKKRRAAIWKTFDARARSIEEPFFKSMNKAFSNQNKEVNETISKALENNKDVGTAIENLFNNKMDEALKHNLAGAFLNGLETGVTFGNENLNKKSVKEISDRVRRLFNIWIDTKGLELCKDINRTTKKKLRKVLSEAIEEGDSLPERKKKMSGFRE